MVRTIRNKEKGILQWGVKAKIPQTPVAHGLGDEGSGG